MSGTPTRKLKRFAGDGEADRRPGPLTHIPHNPAHAKPYEASDPLEAERAKRGQTAALAPEAVIKGTKTSDKDGSVVRDSQGRPVRDRRGAKVRTKLGGFGRS